MATKASSQLQRNENLRNLFASKKKQQKSTIIKDNIRNKSISFGNLQDATRNAAGAVVVGDVQNQPLQRDWALSQSNGYMYSYEDNSEDDDHDVDYGLADNMSVANTNLLRCRSSSQVRFVGPDEPLRIGSLANTSVTMARDGVVRGNQLLPVENTKLPNHCYGSDLYMNTATSHQQPQQYFDQENYGNVGLNNNYRESCPGEFSFTTPKSRRHSMQWYGRKNWLSQEKTDEVYGEEVGYVAPAMAAQQAYNQFERNTIESPSTVRREDIWPTTDVSVDTVNNTTELSLPHHSTPTANIGNQEQNYITDGNRNIRHVRGGGHSERNCDYYYSDEMLKILDSTSDEDDDGVGDGDGRKDDRRFSADVVGYYKRYKVEQGKNLTNHRAVNNRDVKHDSQAKYWNDNEDADGDDIADGEFELVEGSGDEDGEFDGSYSVDDDDDNDYVQFHNVTDSAINNSYNSEIPLGPAIRTTSKVHSESTNKSKQPQFDMPTKKRGHIAQHQRPGPGPRAPLYQPSTTAVEKTPSSATSTTTISVADLMKIRLKPKMSVVEPEQNATAVITNFIAMPSSASPSSSSSTIVAALSTAPTMSNNDDDDDNPLRALGKHNQKTRGRSGLNKNSGVENNFGQQDDMYYTKVNVNQKFLPLQQPNSQLQQCQQKLPVSSSPSPSVSGLGFAVMADNEYPSNDPTAGSSNFLLYER